MATARDWDWANEPRFWDEGPLVPVVPRWSVWLDRIYFGCKVWIAVYAWLILMRLSGNL